MCLAAVIFKAHPAHPLLIATNRDEFYTRPADPAHWWDDHPTVLGGRDVRTAGTWCAIDRRGRFAMVLNPVTPPDASRPRPAMGRGQLVTAWVTGDRSPKHYLHEISTTKADWGDFRLVVGDLASGMAGLSRRAGEFYDPWFVTQGMHCTDSAPGRTHWPKQRYLATGAQELLRHDEVEDADLLALLTRRDPVPLHYGPADYLSLRTPFTTGEVLGTRACTVIRVNRDGRGHFAEHRFGVHAAPLGRSEFSFTLLTDIRRYDGALDDSV